MIRPNMRCKLIVHVEVFWANDSHVCVHYAHFYFYCLLSALLIDRSRSRFSALWYSVFVHTLTIGLIGFGVSYKCKYDSKKLLLSWQSLCLCVGYIRLTLSPLFYYLSIP
jgi:hypothetical protein